MQAPKVTSYEAPNDQRTRQSQDRRPNRRSPPDRSSSLRGEGLRVLAAAGDGRGSDARATAASGTIDALWRGLAGAVADELEARGLGVQPEPAPTLRDRRGLAEALHVGVDTVDRLRRDGCPELTVGDAPRFELDRVLAWLRERRTE